MLRPTDGRASVWRQRDTSFQDNHILGTTAFGGGGVTVWGCFSFDSKLDLYVLDGGLTGQKYRDNVLAPRVVPHFDNHALADRPMFMDDNSRPHRARIVHFVRWLKNFRYYTVFDNKKTHKKTDALRTLHPPPRSIIEKFCSNLWLQSKSTIVYIYHQNVDIKFSAYDRYTYSKPKY